MKIVAGIDPNHSSEALTNLVRRMAFPGLEVTFASLIPYPIIPPAGLNFTPDEMMVKLLDEQREMANAALATAEAAVGASALKTDKLYQIGEASSSLEEVAAQRDGELIAIGSRQHSGLEAALMGSVGRGLTLHSTRSILIVKGAVCHDGPVRAVFAYDASDSCEKSIDLLVKWRPAGISHIDLVIADTPDPHHSPVIDLRGEGAWSQDPEHHRALLLEYAVPAGERLCAAGYEVRVLCVCGPVALVIRGAVVELHADLVILGAQGHGWLERVLFGSTALEQAVTEPHSVLILRP
jgi:nucleotide-binding universal stress UspA family protein